MEKSSAAAAVDMTARDRQRRLSMQAATPAERLAAMRVLIERSWAMLRRNPQGLAHFQSRNYRARAVADLDARMPHGT